MGLLDADSMLRACEVKLVKGESLPAGKALVQQETRLLLKTANQHKDLIALRNRALLYVMVKGTASSWSTWQNRVPVDWLDG
jgi:hypothetical protein